MRYFNRMVYALTLALIFLTVVLYVTSAVTKVKLKEFAGEYKDGVYDLFMPTRYYSKNFILDDTFTINNNEYKIIGYEVIGVYGATSESYVKNDGFFFLIIGDESNDVNEINISLLTLEEEIKIDYTYTKYDKDIPVYINGSTEQSNYFVREDFIKDKIEYKVDKLVIEDSVTFNLDFGKEDYTLKSEMEDYILTNKDIPTVPVGNIKISKAISINSIRPLVYTLLGFIVVFVPITYLIFKPKKRLGKSEPTIGVIKDIEKLNK